MRLMRSFIALVVFMCMAETALAWSRTGHHVVADIAFDLLDDATRKQAVALLRKHPRFANDFNVPPDVAKVKEGDRFIFILAAEWPDIIRDYPPALRNQFAHDGWHHINVPFFLTDLDKKTLEKELKPNLERALPENLARDANPDDLNIVQAIKLCQLRLKDPKVDDDRKAVYLCWLLHLVGDLHQPLHAVSLYSRGRFNERAGDKGGNDVPTLKGSLHSFWDGLLGRTPLNGIGDVNNVRKRTEEIMADKELQQAARKAAADLDIDHWVAESHQLSVSFVYSPLVLDTVKAGEGKDARLKTIDLPFAYREKAGRHAQQRVGEAGFRLARLLEKSLN